MLRRLKRHLWTQIDGKTKQYARCRNCRVLLKISDENGHDDTTVLDEHIGHVLDEVMGVNLREWVRIRVSA